MLYLAVWQVRVVPLLMLLNSDLKFSRDADVELLKSVGEYIDVGVSVHDGSFSPVISSLHRRHPERSEGPRYFAFACS
jgi:hypothetical protein